MNNIYFPSYNRWEKVRGFDFLGVGKIVVPKSQEDLYKKRYGKNVVAIDDKLDGSVAKKRNAVLDIIEREQKDAYGWIIDDDFYKFKRKKENKELSPDECLEQLERIYIMAKDMDAKYGGVDYSEDNMKLKDMAPFSLTKPIFGMCLVKADDGIRYDTRLRINEDVEFWVQKLNNGRRIIKDNQYVGLFYGEDGGKDSVIKYDTADRLNYANSINNKWGGKFMVWKKTRFEFKTPVNGI